MINQYVYYNIWFPSFWDYSWPGLFFCWCHALCVAKILDICTSSSWIHFFCWNGVFLYWLHWCGALHLQASPWLSFLFCWSCFNLILWRNINYDTAYWMSSLTLCASQSINQSKADHKVLQQSSGTLVSGIGLSAKVRIIFIIFWDFLMFYQTFLSAQVNQQPFSIFSLWLKFGMKRVSRLF